METARLMINEEILTDLSDLITRIQAGIDATWAVPGTGQENINISFGVHWKSSDTVTEVETDMRYTLWEKTTAAAKAAVATILNAVKAALAASTYGTFVTAYGYAVIIVKYQN